MDRVDAICRELAEGYDCAKIDTFEEGSNSCAIPWMAEYDSNIGGDNLQGIQSGCLEDNPDGGCAYRVCTIEAHFIASMLSYFINDEGRINDDLRH